MSSTAGAQQGSGSIPISVIVMTKNEETVLPHTLQSIRDFDQIFIVDSHSEDGTCEIAKSMQAEVVQFTWNGQYPKKKEWSLKNLPFRNDWILYLDADELVTANLAAELRALFSHGEPRYAAYDVELNYYFLGRMLRHGHKVSKRVLAHRDRISWPQINDLDVANMWEVEGHYQPIIHGDVGKLSGRLEHNDRDPLYDYFARHNRYSDWEAHLLNNQELATRVQGVRSQQGRRYANIPFKHMAFFIYSFIVRRGFLDGAPGFHYALAHSFYFWQITVKRAELRIKEVELFN
jgi:glycosyltransferase involved in cell wall biosynthesis